MSNWLIAVAAFFVGLVVVVAIVGSLLPRTHVAGRTLHTQRSAADVWPVIVELTEASSVPVDVVERIPPYRLVSRVKSTQKHFGGTWTIMITPTPVGSTLTITEDGWVSNPIFRVISRLVIGHHATIDGMLKQVAKRFDEEPALVGE